jgi:hypothetical protein
MEAAMAFHREAALRGTPPARPVTVRRSPATLVAAGMVLLGVVAGGIWFARGNLVSPVPPGGSGDRRLSVRFVERPDVRTYSYSVQWTADGREPGSTTILNDSVVTVDRELNHVQQVSDAYFGGPVTLVSQDGVTQRSHDGANWQRRGWNGPELGTAVLMYSDVVDFELRGVEPQSIGGGTIEASAVTTVTWVLDLDEFPRAAPTVWNRGTWGDLLGTEGTVTITLSFDERDVVRELDVEVDVTDWNDIDSIVTVHERYRLLDVSDVESSDLVFPADSDPSANETTPGSAP